MPLPLNPRVRRLGARERCTAPGVCPPPFRRQTISLEAVDMGVDQGCLGREGTSEAAPEAVRQADGGGCQSGWRRLLSVTNAVEASTCCQGDSGWA